jgi:uncharacterized protein (DUF362 family)
MDVTVACIDVVAVDAVGAAIMGLQPEQVLYLKRAQERGLGTCDLGKIQIVGGAHRVGSMSFHDSLLKWCCKHLFYQV